MRHRINQWLQRLLVPVVVIAVFVLVLLGVTAVQMFAVIAAIVLVFVVLMIAVEPGPRTKDLLQRLRSRHS